MGLNAAHGKYIGFIDADDFISPNMYEKMYEEAERIDADIIECNHCLSPTVCFLN